MKNLKINNMNKLKQAIQLINEHIEEQSASIKEPFRNIKAKWTGTNRAELTWETDLEGEFDIEFYAVGRHPDWHRSVHFYKPDHGRSVLAENERFEIGTSSDNEDWGFRIVDKFGVFQQDYASDAVVLKAKGTKPEPSPNPEPTPWKASFSAITGAEKGCYNIHGITDD